MTLITSPARPGASRGAEASSSNSSPALEWLWQRLSDVRHPHVLDCGPVRQSTVNVLLKRGAKLYVADLISPVRRNDPELWDRRGKQPVFLSDRFLAQLPHIPSGSLSAILCWHLLDLLPRGSLSVIVDRFCSFLKSGGAIFCLLREPYLPSGADSEWWLETLAVLGTSDKGREPFRFPSLTNREVERLAPSCTVKTFLTRTGRRGVLAMKQTEREV